MRSRSSALAWAVIVLLLVEFIPAQPADAGYAISCRTRSQALDYAYGARYEGYDWGGGWWNLNDQMDTDEGPDCSGFTFKTWAMSSSTGSTAKYFWYTMDDVHGPYTATAFRDGCSGACYDVCGSGTSSACGSSSYGSTYYMDAFARDGHIGMIYGESSSGYDYIIHAKGEAYGVVFELLNYRMQTAYDGVSRYSWNSSCQ